MFIKLCAANNSNLRRKKIIYIILFTKFVALILLQCLTRMTSQPIIYKYQIDKWTICLNDPTQISIIFTNVCR